MNMKKIAALCLTACMLLSAFVSCGPAEQTTETTTATEDTQEKSYLDENGMLRSCVGQADENGVYVVPENITMIAEGAFAGDTKLKEVVIGENVKVIGSGAFQGCSALEKVSLPDGLEILGSYAFAGCSVLTDIALPASLTVIDEYTFLSCTALESIDLTHIKSVGNSAFLYCSALESVSFSSALQEIDDWAFAQCASLENVDFDGVTALKEIGDYVFTGCSMLRRFDIPAGVERIGILAFYDCTRLSSVSIPETVKSVDYAALNYTPWYQDHTENYLIVGDGVLIKCTDHPTRIDLSGKGIKALGGALFRNAAMNGEAAEYGYKYAESLETIVIPEGVREIGTSAFAGCYQLREVTLPASLEIVSDNAFNVFVEGIDTPAKIDISVCEKLSYIGNYAFFGCKGLETIVLPDTVREIGEYAFGVTGAIDNFLEKASAAEDEKDRYLILGDGILVTAYVADGQTAVNVPEGVKMIAGSAFCGWDNSFVPNDTEGLSHSGASKYNITFNVKTLTLPEGLEKIGNMAFFRMSELEKVVFPSTLTEIGSDAFGFCNALSSISGGENLETIGDIAFRYCDSIPHFSFSSNTKNIGDNIFEGCSSLQTVRLPEGLADPGTSLFNDACTSLSRVSLDKAARPRIYSILGTVMQSVDVVYYND